MSICARCGREGRKQFSTFAGDPSSYCSNTGACKRRVGARDIQEACACWANNYSLGHDGHCCFLIDERAGVSANKWRDYADICHRPDGAA